MSTELHVHLSCTVSSQSTFLYCRRDCNQHNCKAGESFYCGSEPSRTWLTLDTVSAFAASRVLHRPSQLREDSSNIDTLDSDGEEADHVLEATSIEGSDSGRDTEMRDNEAAEDALRTLEADWRREQRDAVISPAYRYSTSDKDITTALEVQRSRAQRLAVMRQLPSFTHPNPAKATEIDTFLTPNGALEITVKPGENILIVGQCELKVLSGIITLSGAMLTHLDGRQSVFASARHPLPVIKCLEGVTRVEVYSSEKGIEALALLSPHYRRLWSNDVQTHVGNKSFTLINELSIEGQRLYQQRFPHDWGNFIHNIVCEEKARPSQICVTGAQGVGKSTFCRTIANYLLTVPACVGDYASSYKSRGATVCWLDLDPGQSEISPPGQISLVHLSKPLFGPPFTHAYVEAFTVNRLVHAHCIGTTSAHEALDFYLNCVEDLHKRYQVVLHDHPDCPLIVNFPGWSAKRYTSEMTLRLLERLRKRTDVVVIGNDPLYQRLGLENLFEAIKPAQLHCLQSTKPDSTVGRFSAISREMQMISYLHSLPGPGDDPYWLATPIEDQVPWILHYDGDGREIVGISTQHTHPSTPELLLTVLRKWVVGLCIVEDEVEIETASQSLRKTEAENLPYWPMHRSAPVYHPTPANSRLIGWAYIAEITPEDRTIALITPLSPHAREEALLKTQTGLPRLVLIRGQTDPSDWVYLEKMHLQESRNRAHGVTMAAKRVKESQEGELQLSSANEHLGGPVLDPGIDYVKATLRKAEVRATSRVGLRSWATAPRIAKNPK